MNAWVANSDIIKQPHGYSCRRSRTPLPGSRSGKKHVRRSDAGLATPMDLPLLLSSPSRSPRCGNSAPLHHSRWKGERARASCEWRARTRGHRCEARGQKHRPPTDPRGQMRQPPASPLGSGSRRPSASHNCTRRSGNEPLQPRGTQQNSTALGQRVLRLVLERVARSRGRGAVASRRPRPASAARSHTQTVDASASSPRTSAWAFRSSASPSSRCSLLRTL